MLSTHSLDDVVALIDARIRALASEEIAAAQAFRRVLAADIVAAADFPPFDRAIVDGVALRSAETVGASAYNPLAFRVVANTAGLEANTAMRVRAAGRLPLEADCVVPDELVQSGAAGTVEIIEALAPENEIERRASHFARGTALLRAGNPLRSVDLGLIATAGVERVAVVQRPRVAIVLSTAGAADAVASILAPLVARDGGVITRVGHIEWTRAAMAAAVGDADLVLMVGGPTHGRDQESAAAFAQAGTLEVAEIALSPAGSLTIGTTGSTWLFSLPGAAAACFWAYEIVAGRAIRRLAGRSPAMPFRQASLRLKRKIVSAIGTTEICPVRRLDDGIEPASGYSSANLLALGRADGFVIVSEGSEGMPAGTIVPVHLFGEDGGT
jgi:molybdopterin molybdotransferase